MSLGKNARDKEIFHMKVVVQNNKNSQHYQSDKTVQILSQNDFKIAFTEEETTTVMFL